MKAICLGGAGRIAREALYDLVEFSDFEKIAVADCDEAEGRKVAQWLNDPRADFVRVDVTDHEATANVLKDYDVALDGTTIALNSDSTACIAKAGIHGINLNGFGAEDEYDDQFQKHGKTYQNILTHTHPASDGSEPGWEKLRAYTRNVGIPMAIGAILLAQGKVERAGVITPEEAFDPEVIFTELKRRRLIIHEQKTELSDQ